MKADPGVHSKRFSWPQYVASLHERSHCSTWLLVLSDDRRVAAWARRGVESFQPNVGCQPLVIGPEEFPSIVEIEEASASPELAVLSALMRRDGDDAGRLRVRRWSLRWAWTMSVPGGTLISFKTCCRRSRRK